MRLSALIPACLLGSVSALPFHYPLINLHLVRRSPEPEALPQPDPAAPKYSVVPVDGGSGAAATSAQRAQQTVMELVDATKTVTPAATTETVTATPPPKTVTAAPSVRTIVSTIVQHEPETTILVTTTVEAAAAPPYSVINPDASLASSTPSVSTSTTTSVSSQTSLSSTPIPSIVSAYSSASLSFTTTSSSISASSSISLSQSIGAVPTDIPVANPIIPPTNPLPANPSFVSQPNSTFSTSWTSSFVADMPRLTASIASPTSSVGDMPRLTAVIASPTPSVDDMPRLTASIAAPTSTASSMSGFSVSMRNSTSSTTSSTTTSYDDGLWHTSYPARSWNTTSTRSTTQLTPTLTPSSFVA